MPSLEKAVEKVVKLAGKVIRASERMDTSDKQHWSEERCRQAFHTRQRAYSEMEDALKDVEDAAFDVARKAHEAQKGTTT